MNKQGINFNQRSLHGGKYENAFFIEKYVALWAYGYKNNIGQSEGLYRAINELGFSCFNRDGNYRILDVGCGVGRTTADYAKFFRNAEVIGIDNAHLMIAMALQVNKEDKEIHLDISKLGFGNMSLRGENIDNLNFQETTLVDFFSGSPKSSFDIITAVNFIDRIFDIRQGFEMIFSLLKSDGVFIFATPLNFSSAQDWEKYSSLNSLSTLMQEIGFSVDVKFDGLIYREILDARGATEEYSTVVMRLTKSV